MTCDCDLATLIPDVGDSFEVQIEEESPLITNKWLIPPDYTPLSPDKLYHQVIQSSNSSETDIRNYTNRDEVLIPAPFGYKSKLKIRKSWHFFVGTDSGNPSEIGRVTACSPQSARHFLEMVKQRALPGFEDFDLTVSSFYLESVEKLKLGYGAGVSFIDEQTDTGILKRIRISRKIL